MKYYFKENICDYEFEKFLKSQKVNSLMQHPQWSSVKKDWNSNIIGVYRGGIVYRHISTF